MLGIVVEFTTWSHIEWFNGCILTKLCTNNIVSKFRSCIYLHLNCCDNISCTVFIFSTIFIDTVLQKKVLNFVEKICGKDVCY